MRPATFNRILGSVLGILIVLLLAAIFAVLEQQPSVGDPHSSGVASASPVELPPPPPIPSPTLRPVEWVEILGRLRDTGRDQELLRLIGLLEGQSASVFAANDLYALAGDAARDLGELDRALNFYRLALQLGSPLPELLRLREAQTLADLGQPLAAEQAAAGLGTRAHLILASAWRRAGKLPQAEAHFRQVTADRRASRSTQDEARFELARVLVDQGRDSSAAAELRTLAMGRRKTAVATGALELLRALEAKSPQLAASLGAADHLKRGERLYESGHFGSAIAELEAAIAKARSRIQSSEARFLLGRIEYRREDFERAIQRFHDAADADSQPGFQQQCLMQAARCLQLLGRFQEASGLHRRIRALDPRTEEAAWAAYELASQLERQGEPEQAAAAFESLGLSKGPQNVVAAAALQAIRVRAALGQSASAVATAERLLATSPRGRQAPEAWLFLGRELRRLGRRDEALAAYRRCAKELPGTLHQVLAQRAIHEITGARPFEPASSLRSLWTLDLRQGASRPRPLATDLFTGLQRLPGLLLRGGSFGIVPAPVFGSTLERDRWLLAQGPGDITRARLHLRLRQLDDAAEALVSALKTTPRDPDLLWSLIDLSRRLDRPHRALHYAERSAGLLAERNPLLWPRPLLTEVYPQAFPAHLAEFAARAGVDPLFVLAVIRQESRFDPAARSLAAARGLMQIVPVTFEGLRSHLARPELRIEDLDRPETNLELGIAYLRQLGDRFGDRPEVVLAAYNAGPGNAERWLSGSGDEDLLGYLASISFKETRDYVRIVLYNWWVYHALYRGGLEPPQFLAGTTAAASEGERSERPRGARADSRP